MKNYQNESVFFKQHYESNCFDLKCFQHVLKVLTVNFQKITWICAIIEKIVRIHRIYQNGLFRRFGIVRILNPPPTLKFEKSGTFEILVLSYNSNIFFIWRKNCNDSMKIFNSYILKYTLVVARRFLSTKEFDRFERNCLCS